jgi:hypothetical protein
MGMSDLLTGVPIPDLDPAAVAVACARVRRICGWHIAPVVTETITLPWSWSGRYLLPSLHVVSVGTTVAGSAVTSDWSPGGALWLTSGNIAPPVNARLRGVSVTLTHGYETCPEDVRDIVAQMARQVGQRRVRSSAEGPFSTTYEVEEFGLDLDAYRLPALA